MLVTDIIARLGGPSKAAVRLGQKRSTVSMWLVHQRLPSRHAKVVAEALGVTVTDVWPSTGATEHVGDIAA